MKTTAKHFSIFKSECLKWVEIFGLKDYEVNFRHGGCGKGNIALCERNCNSRTACLSLCKTWPENGVCKLSNDIICVAAFEEVCHILLWGLSSCAHARHIMEHEINEAEHGLIRVLQSVLYPKY